MEKYVFHYKLSFSEAQKLIKLETFIRLTEYSSFSLYLLLYMLAYLLTTYTLVVE